MVSAASEADRALTSITRIQRARGLDAQHQLDCASRQLTVANGHRR
jgi:hypothetical protein